MSAQKRDTPTIRLFFQHVGTKEEYVRVRKKDLERLTTEVMQIRDFLPRILNGEVLESFQKLKVIEKSEFSFVSSSP